MARLSRRAFIPFNFVPVMDESKDKDTTWEQNAMTKVIITLDKIDGKHAKTR